MVRLRNKVTGAVMSVQESTASRLGSEWVPADKPKAEPAKSPSRRTAKNKSDD
ncbi:DUF7302 family protein [Streptomyces rubiginosohelvolus]|uniref:DUF7302 family protein n=1 Tax=Streptomyces rubiginosohelvolus TaxID=67362 RepID=UPI003F4DED23